MSTHLVTCAAQVNLKPSEKLVLLCLAENANSKDSRAFPGMATLRTWTGLGDASIYRILSRLEEFGLIEQVGAGFRGRAAEFLVLPFGCCEAHGKDPINKGAVDPEDPWNGSHPVEAPDPCGNSHTVEAFSEKASHLRAESLSSETPKGRTHATPTKYPPRTPPVVEQSVTETAARTADNILDFSTYRKERITAERGFAGHEGHEVIVRIGDGGPFLDCMCRTLLLLDPEMVALYQETEVLA